MSRIYHKVLGWIDVPEFDRVTFLPGRTTGHDAGFQALITAVSRDGQTGRVKQAVHGFGLIPTDGLFGRWRADEGLQRHFHTPDEFASSFSEGLRRLARCASQYPLSPHAGGNERTDNGAKIVMKLQYNVSSPDRTASYPVFMAVSNLSSLAAAHGDLSIGSATHDVTTNEYTNHGLARTSALTPTPTVPSTLDGQYTITIANTYTDTVGGDTAYGGAMFDAAVGTSNMFMEYAYSSVALNLNDTLTQTLTAKG